MNEPQWTTYKMTWLDYMILAMASIHIMKSFSRIWLCDPMDCSLPGSSLHGILQERVLEWVAISFSIREREGQQARPGVRAAREGGGHLILEGLPQPWPNLSSQVCLLEASQQNLFFQPVTPCSPPTSLHEHLLSAQPQDTLPRETVTRVGGRGRPRARLFPGWTPRSRPLPPGAEPRCPLCGRATACRHVCACPQSLPTLCDPKGLCDASLPCPWDFPGKNTGVGCCFLLQGIFLTQGWNPSLLHWQAESLPLSHECVFNFTVYSSQLCILLTCRFWFRRCEAEPEILQLKALGVASVLGPGSTLSFEGPPTRMEIYPGEAIQFSLRLGTKIYRQHPPEAGSGQWGKEAPRLVPEAKETAVCTARKLG